MSPFKSRVQQMLMTAEAMRYLEVTVSFAMWSRDKVKGYFYEHNGSIWGHNDLD